ncbi:GT2 family glycosyltransferase [Rhodoblastus acidophilus]|uniref:glycosyltransferase family 2 protein n=1 Tax=Rhodoblastus acidophilus TaxID=1074 RepID=UPI0022252EF1|nr:glycosyltransferase family 2 protein [Rhodoblastus acidophilus]MCW2316619.1 GT2 family glycosyltransferase [Rhodoblastus acidophilus]
MIYVILINWNGWRDTAECLESLRLCAEPDFRVIVCDNGSTDDSLARLEQWARGALGPFDAGPPWRRLQGPRRAPKLARRAASDRAGDEWISLVALGDNLGFAGGNNAGIAMALRDPACDFICLLNNDTVVDPAALTALRRKMRRDPTLAVCGPTLLFYDRPDRVQSLGGFWKASLARGGHIGLGLPSDALPPVAEVERRLRYVAGAALFMRRGFVERFGRIYDGYFLYFEELEIAAQLRADERLGWCPEAVVYHKEGASIGACEAGRRGLRSTYYLAVNLLRYHLRHAPQRLPVALARLAWERHKLARLGDRPARDIIGRAVADFFTRTYRRADLAALLGPADRRPAE